MERSGDYFFVFQCESPFKGAHGLHHNDHNKNDFCSFVCVIDD